MFIVTAKVEAWEEDFPGSRVKWVVGQSREVHDSLVDKFRNNPAAWTVSGGSDSSPMQVTKTVAAGLIFTAGGQDISAMIGAGSNPIVARQYTEATKTDADVVATTMFSHVFQPGAVVAGDSIVVDGLFSYPSSATLKKLRCKIGATNFLVYDASTSQSFEWRIKIRMRSLTAQVAHASGSSSGGFGIIGSAYPIEAALDFALAQTLEVTAEWGTAGAGSNAIVLEAVDVRVERLAV